MEGIGVEDHGSWSFVVGMAFESLGLLRALGFEGFGVTCGQLFILETRPFLQPKLLTATKLLYIYSERDTHEYLDPSGKPISSPTKPY